MKRSELQVGAHLYLDRSKDWDTARSYGDHVHGSRVEVVAAEGYEVGYTGNIRPGKGSGVLVQHIGRDGTVGRRDVVQLAHLRGPWEVLAPAARRREELARAEDERRSNERKSGVANMKELTARLEALTGVSLYVDEYSNGSQVTVNADKMAVIVAALEAAQVSA